MNLKIFSLQIRRQYVLNCVADIKQTTHCVLPAVKQLYAICK